MLGTDEQAPAVLDRGSESDAALHSGSTDQVEQLACTMRESLSAEAVLIAERCPDGTLVPAGATGLAAGAMTELLDALSRIDGRPLGAIAANQDFDAAVAALTDGGELAFCVPLAVDGERVGVLCIHPGEGERPDDDVLRSLARHAALSLARARRSRSSSLLPQALALQEEFDRFALSTTCEEELSSMVSSALARILDVPMTALVIFNEDRGVLQMVPGAFGAADERVRSYQISVLDLRSNTARVFATGQPYLSNDAVSDPGIRPAYVQAFGIERVLSVPLTLGSRRIGVLHLANKRNEFTLEDLHRAEALSPRIATAVELARTSFRLRREQRLEGVLCEMALGIAAGAGLQSLLPPALEELSAVTEASVVALIPNDASPVVNRRCSVSPELERTLLVAGSAEPASRSHVMTPQAVGDPGWAAFHAPVELDGVRVATLSALRGRAEPFESDERRALSRVAQLAALAWATESYQQQAAQLARVQERERVSGELHADVQQLLTEAQSRLDTAMTHRSMAAADRERLVQARRLVIRSFTAIRSVAHHLSRPAECDLPLRLRATTSSVEHEFSLPIRLELSPGATDIARALSVPLADLIVKVAREALVNVAKHGGGGCSATVRLNINGDKRLHLTVLDDGVGVGTSGGGHGLSSLRRELREQGGRLQVRAVPTGGTRVLATVPLRG